MRSPRSQTVAVKTADGAVKGNLTILHKTHCLLPEHVTLLWIRQFEKRCQKKHFTRAPEKLLCRGVALNNRPGGPVRIEPMNEGCIVCGLKQHTVSGFAGLERLSAPDP
jgi:hypothetical protein